MSIFSKRSYQVPPFRPGDKNPIPAILELIPLTDTIVDPKLLDLIAMELCRVGSKSNNSIVMCLLLELHREDLINLTCIEYPSTLGQLFIIKRNV